MEKQSLEVYHQKYATQPHMFWHRLGNSFQSRAAPVNV